MNELRTWFCHRRGDLLRWSILLAVATPLGAWSLSRTFAIDGRNVVVIVAALLFAVWRPYRDSWLRTGCSSAKPCASH